MLQLNLNMLFNMYEW